MEFFKTIADFLQDGQQVQIAIRKSGDSIAVSIMPDNRGVKDKSVDNIAPLVMSGSPQDFEDGFAEALKPLQEAQGFMSTLKKFEEDVEKAKKESDMAKKLKDEAAKQKKEFNDLIALARKNKDEHKFSDARNVLAKAKALPSAEKNIIDKVMKEIDDAAGVGNMFGCEEDMSDGKDTADKDVFSRAIDIEDDDNEYTDEL